MTDLLGTNENPMDPVNDFFDEAFQGFKPSEIKDDNDFEPLTGKYIVRVAKLKHEIGVSQRDGSTYDFYSLNMQVIETIDGDKGNNRYLTKKYQNTPEKLKALMNDLFTAGIEFDSSSRQAFDLSLVNAIDKQMRVRAWTWKPEKKMDGTPIAEEDRVALQQLKIVKEFGTSKKKSAGSEVPF